MIETYAISRNDFYILIKYSKKTPDGYYWYPNFHNLCLKSGKNSDDGYYYDRKLFEYKLYFKPEELEAFVSKKKIDIDIDFMYRKSIKFYENNKELKYLDLKDNIPSSDYNLHELIDCFEYIYKD